MHFNPKRLLFAAALMAGMSVFVPDALAVPAKPGLVERHQEDGSTILVRLCGDEFSHYLLSEDGYPLVEEGGEASGSDTLAPPPPPPPPSGRPHGK